MISAIDIEAMQAVEHAEPAPEPYEGYEGADVSELLDAAHRFSQSVCELFTTDANWSVYDLEGAEAFFHTIGYVPPGAAVVAGDNDDDTEDEDDEAYHS